MFGVTNATVPTWDTVMRSLYSASMSPLSGEMPDLALRSSLEAQGERHLLDERSVRGVTAVDHVLGARDVAGFVREEEDR
jgi:hypothetical protein